MVSARPIFAVLQSCIPTGATERESEVVDRSAADPISRLRSLTGLLLALVGFGILVSIPALAGTITDVGDVFVDSSNNLIVGSAAQGERWIDSLSDGPYANVTIVGNLSSLYEPSLIAVDHGGSLTSLGGFSVATTGLRAELKISNASTVETSRLLIGAGIGSGSIGGGSVLVENGSALISSDTQLLNVWATSSITVSGIGSKWINSGQFLERANLGNEISIVNGGYASTGSTNIASDYARTRLSVIGVGSIWDTGAFRLGTRFSSDDPNDPHGGLQILSGGLMRSTNVTMTTQTGQTALVRGQGSKWIISGALGVLGNAAGGNSRISIEDGGHLESGSAVVSATGGNESISVSGPESTFQVGNLSIRGTADEGQTAAVSVSEGALLRTDGVSISGCGHGYIPGCLLSVDGAESRWIADGSVTAAAAASGIAEVAVARGAQADIRDTLTLGINSQLSLDHGVVSAGRVDLTEGALRGTGVIDGDVYSNGNVAPGDTSTEDIGGLLIHGAFVQGATGVLDIQLGGIVPGIEHDVLAVVGTSFLGGTLRVQLSNGYVPRIGDSFDVLASASVSGEFNSYVGLQVSPNLNLRVDYLPFGVRLTAVPEPGTAFLIGLGLAGLAVKRSRPLLLPIL